MSVGHQRAIAREEIIRAALIALDFVDAHPDECTVKPVPSQHRGDVFLAPTYLDRPTWQWYVYLTGVDCKRGQRATYRVLVEYSSGRVAACSYREI